MKLTRLAAATGMIIAAGVGGIMVASPAAAYPTGTAAFASINATTFPPGGTATVTVSNYTPGASLTLYIESAPVVIASGVIVPKNGATSISGAIPAGYSGNHTIAIRSTAGGDENRDFGIVVTSGGGGGNGGGNGSGGGLADTGAAVTGIGILGVALVAGGVFFVMAGRKRTAANSTI